MESFWIAAIVFLAIFTQTVAGFGLALVSMPLLVGVVGIRMAAPLVALIGLAAEIILLAHYRQALDVRAVARLVVASVLGVPLGVLALRQIDERITLTLLGAVVIGYALYALLDYRLPEVEHPAWAYGLGFVAGILSGAYNISGPLVVIYGSCRRWSPAEFKSNLQGFFVLNSLTAVVAHALGGNYAAPVWEGFLVALPAIGLAALAGFALDNRLDPARFRKIVLVLLVVLGVQLIL